jgi:transposase
MIVFAQKIYVYRDPIDMRQSINGLSILVSADGGDLGLGSTFLFVNRYGDKIKILVREDNGFVLIYKRLDRGKFRLGVGDHDQFTITPKQARWLLDGLDWQSLKGQKTGNKKHYF